MKSTTLHRGELSFSAFDVGEGPVVLCLHGFPDTARSFRHQLPPLAEAGFRAIAPHMRGYEPSSQPRDRDYSMLAMAKDVVAWIDELGLDRVHLVGHDWGAMVAYVAAAFAPTRFHSLTTLAIAHPRRLHRELWRLPRQFLLSWYIGFFQLRGLAELVVSARNFAFIDALWRKWSPGYALPAEERAHLRDTLRAPGVKRAALAYYREHLFPFTRSSRAAVRLLASPIDVRTLALTGALDGCMDTRLHDVMMHPRDFARGLEVVRVQGAGHFLQMEKPDEVTAHLIRWLRAGV